MAVPAFDYDVFISRYPQFASLSSGYCSDVYLYEASNLGQIVSSIWCDPNTQAYWLNVTLAHILTLEQLGLTGRLSSVTQGSESANFDLSSPQWAGYWNETVYGQKIYQAIQEFVAGGHYVSNGQMPYSGSSMNGAWELGFYGW